MTPLLGTPEYGKLPTRSNAKAKGVVHATESSMEREDEQDRSMPSRLVP
jgi:hypothetical protein